MTRLAVLADVHGNQPALEAVEAEPISFDLLARFREVDVWRYTSAQHYLEVFRAYYGPTLRAFEALDGAASRRSPPT